MCVVYAKQMNQDLKDQSHDADDVNEASTTQCTRDA